MPPPRLPKAAAGLASAVSRTVIDITRRQETTVSHSDVVRGVHAARRDGLVVVDYEFSRIVCDAAHIEGENGHNQGFCKACAAIYVAVNKALSQCDKVDD